MKAKLDIEVEFEDWGDISINGTNALDFFNEYVVIDPMICGQPEFIEISIDRYKFKNIEIMQ